jgi:hypothetical protein
MSYNWIEIENTGDPHDMGPDHFSERISIGFSFPFYDNIYQYLWICSNGFIAFNNYSPSRWDTPIPCDTQPNDIIAPFWDDFNPAGSPTNVYTQLFINPTYFVIEFVDMPRVGTNEYETFEIIITPGGHIKFQYPEVVNATSATVGIENETGTRGSQWAHNPHCNIPHSLAVGFIRAEGDMMEDDYLTSEAAEVHSYLPNSVNLTISPNPFNLRANINFELLSPAKVTLKAYDLTGREVAIIANGDFTSGKHSLVWNAQNLPSGIYFIQLDAGGITSVSRALLMK